MSVLSIIQSKLNAPKNQYNSFGKYNYRSCEDILLALKPLLAEHQATILLSDEVVEVGSFAFLKATATFKCGDEIETVSAFAKHPLEKKGMDDSQITGAASSYARKYALNGLFAIDDNKDPDATNQHGKDNPPVNPPPRSQRTQPQVQQTAPAAPPADPIDTMLKYLGAFNVTKDMIEKYFNCPITALAQQQIATLRAASKHLKAGENFANAMLMAGNGTENN